VTGSVCTERRAPVANVHCIAEIFGHRCHEMGLSQATQHAQQRHTHENHKRGSLGSAPMERAEVHVFFAGDFGS